MDLKLKLESYPKQREFIECTDPNGMAFVAGVGSGKTRAGAIKALIYCLKNPGCKGLVTAPYSWTLEKATVESYRETFPYEFIVKQKSRPYHEWRLANGSEIYFRSTDNVDSIVGFEIAWAHMDEASRSPYAAYANTKKRLRQRTPEGESFPYLLWITTTPKQLNWLYREITKPNNPIKMFNASTKDNTFLTEAQRQAYIESLNLTEKEFEQEIEGRFILLAGETLVSGEVLENRLQDCFEPIETRDSGQILIWREPVVGVKYVAGADCADEGGGGVNDLIIMDSQTGEEMAEINADIPADHFAKMCFDLCRDYNFPLLAPERNGTVGGIVVTKLIDMGYSNLYIDDKGKEGWYTSAHATPPQISRFQMLKEYEEAIRLRRAVIRSTEAIGELSTFIREKETYQPREGCRSDRIMARAICWQMRKHVNKYGNKNGVMSIRREVTSYS